MKILISTWGNPEGWDEVTYNYKNKYKKSKDPLPLIKEKEEINKIIIISVDTLADEKIGNSQINSYDSLRSKAEEIIKGFCKNNLGCVPDKIIISYGVGEFNRIKFIGNAMDFYYEIFKELSFSFKEWFSDILSHGFKENIEVFLDISHGINFLPVLTYRALREILQILAYTFEIKLIVLNSDTYLRSVKPSELNINIIEESKILPKLITYLYSKRNLEPFRPDDFDEQLNDNEKRELSSDINRFPDELYYFLSAFMYYLPVFVINYLPDFEDLKRIIDDLSEGFKKYITISRNQNNKWIVKRKFRFTINYENLIKSFLVSWLLSINGFTKKKDIDLEEIKSLKDKIWQADRFPIEANRIDVEIEKIKNTSPSEEYQIYAELLREKVQKNVDKRNFFAHSGFEHNAVKLRKSGDKIEISVNTELKHHIESNLKRNLPRVDYD